MILGNDNASGFRFGVEITPDRPVPALSKLAAEAERAELDTVFVSNHFDNRDTFQTLAAIGQRTDRISYGPGVVNPFETHPVRLASQIATLVEADPDRVLFGIGAGDKSTLTKLGIERQRPVGHVAETISIVRNLLAGERVTGESPDGLSNAALSFAPGNIPIYVGAQGQSMLRMAAQLGDGVLINAAHPSDYRAAREHLNVGEKRRSADRVSPHIVGFVSTSVDTDGDAARSVARRPVAFIVAGASRRVINRHGIDQDRVESIRNWLATGDHQRAYEAVTDRMRSAFCVAGTPTEVEDRLTYLADHVDAIVAGAPLGPDRREAMGHLGSVGARLQAEQVFAG